MSQQFFSEPIAQINVQDLAARLAEGAAGLQLIDVREVQEIAIASLPGFDNLPLSEFAEWSEQILTRFDPDTETLVLCHHGSRSTRMCHWLREQGFQDVKNITGGIEAYSQVVDPSIPSY
jgi:rhodanese-related sulfurtransferase